MARWKGAVVESEDGPRLAWRPLDMRLCGARWRGHEHGWGRARYARCRSRRDTHGVANARGEATRRARVRVGVGGEIGGSVGAVGSWALPGAGEEDVAETGAAGTSAAESAVGTGGADVVGTSVAEGAVRMSVAGTGAADADGAVVVDVAAVVGADKGAGAGAGAVGTRAVAARGAGAAVEIADPPDLVKQMPEELMLRVMQTMMSVARNAC